MRSPRPTPKVVIGSYPFFDPQHGPNTNVVLRARDAQKLALAKRAVEDMLERVRGGTIEERLIGVLMQFFISGQNIAIGAVQADRLGRAQPLSLVRPA